MRALISILCILAIPMLLLDLFVSTWVLAEDLSNDPLESYQRFVVLLLVASIPAVFLGGVGALARSDRLCFWSLAAGTAAVWATVPLLLIMGNIGFAEIVESLSFEEALMFLFLFRLPPITLATFLAGRLLFADGHRKRPPKRCSGCGNLNLLTANFCRFCGLTLARDR